MKYRKIKWNSELLIYSVSFLIIVLAGYLPLWKDGLSIIWEVDGIGQYYPAFIYIGQYIQRFLTDLFHGSLSLPLYDLSIGMGEDIIGVLSYYGFGDPINLLAVFAVIGNGVYWFTLSFFLRIWLAGLSFQAYCREINLNLKAALAASLCYIFSGFAVYGGGRYIGWLSVLIYFPLLLLGTERIFKKNRPSLVLILGVAYGGACGFYYLYMASLCLGLYWIVRLFFIYGIKKLKKMLISGWYLTGSYILGLCLVAPLFIPAVSAYFNSERAGAGIAGIIFDIQNYLPVRNDTVFTVFFDFFHYRRLELSGFFLVESVALLLLFTIRSRAAFQLKIALGISLIALHLPITGWLFNGFGETNERWVFCLHFLMAVVFAYVLTMVQKRNIFFVRQEVKLAGKSIINAFVFILVLTNAVFNIRLLYSTKTYGSGWSREMIPSNNIEVYIDSPVNYSKKMAEDNDLYRVTNTSLTNINGRPENVAMLNDYYGTTWWFSIVNADTQSYVNTLLERDIGWRSFGFDNHPIFEAFSGVKYPIARDTEEITNDYSMVEQTMFNGEVWNIYENPFYFGMVYSRNSEISRQLWDEKVSYEAYFEKQYELLTTGHNDILGTYEDSKDLFTCSVNVSADEEVVFLIPYHKNWKAYVDGVKVETRKADLAYIAITPGEGEHEIVLRYESMEFRMGMVLAVISFAVIVGIFWKQREIR